MRPPTHFTSTPILVLLLIATLLAAITSPGGALSQANAAPSGPHDVFFPSIFRWNVPPMVTLEAARISDGSGAAKSAFLPGETIRFTASGRNFNTGSATVSLQWDWQGACGSQRVISTTLTIAPGNWTHTATGAAPACSDLYLNTVRVSNGILSAAQSALFAVNLPSQAVRETRQGFDICQLPSIEQMQTWWNHSPYWVFNIYLGGSMFYCQDDIPDAFWVHLAAAQGWKFILTWVGPQAPCSSYRVRMSADAATAQQQGRTEAEAAAAAAARMGIMGSRLIYYDLEAYSSNASTECRATVSSFIKGWTKRLHELGFPAGGYGSPVTSYIADWAANNPPPDYIWIAHYVLPYQYNANQTVWSSYLSNGLWADHQRLRQYAGGHSETWGGTAMVVDSNAIDGGVTRIPTSTLAMASQPEIGLTHASQMRSFEQLSATEGWVLRENSLLMTRDGGQSWIDISPAGNGSEAILGAAFLDSRHAWVARLPAPDANDRLDIFSTSNAGSIWDEHTLVLPPSATSGQAIAAAFLDFRDPTSGFMALKLASGSSFSLGRLFFTHDGGQTWEERSLPLGEAVRFRDPLHGWTAGGPGGDKLFQTKDGGSTWQRQALQIPGDLSPKRLFIGLPAFSRDGKGTLPVTVSAAGGSELLVYESKDGFDWHLAALQNVGGGAALPGTVPFSALPSGGWLAAVPAERQLLGAAPGAGSAAMAAAASLPDGVVGLSFIDPRQGWALVQAGDCLGDKSDTGSGLRCEQLSRLLATADGGRTWREILK